MPECLANAYCEEPDALIVLVRICGGAARKRVALPGKWKCMELIPKRKSPGIPGALFLSAALGNPQEGVRQRKAGIIQPPTLVVNLDETPGG